MSVYALALLLVFACGAAFVQRVTGFGFGIFIMTMLPHIMPSYTEATALSGLLATVTVLIVGIKYRQFLDWRKLWLILAVFAVFSLVSIVLMGRYGDLGMKKVLGVILIAASVYFFASGGSLRLGTSRKVQAGMGALSGVMGGFFAMQGPPAVVYFISCTDTKEEYTALTAWYFLIGNSLMTGFRASQGFVTPVVCKCFLLALPAVILGMLAGKAAYRKMPITTMRKCVYAYMALSGVIALIRF